MLLGVIGPDLCFVLAIGTTTPAPQRMPARVVPVYNLLHRPVVPLVIGVAAAGLRWWALTVLAIAWLSHIVWDRSVGYRLRNPDGSMTTPGRRRA